jgi:uncharacterized protein
LLRWCGTAGQLKLVARDVDRQVGPEDYLGHHSDPRRYQMAHPNEDQVREGFAAFGRGDMDALRNQYWTEDIRWHNPGRGPLAGDYEGPEQVIQSFARLFELTGGTVSLELHDVLANDEHAVALFTLRGERAGKQLAGNWAQVFHMRDGKISESWLHPADQYAADEFLS